MRHPGFGLHRLPVGVDQVARVPQIPKPGTRVVQVQVAAGLIGADCVLVKRLQQPRRLAFGIGAGDAVPNGVQVAQFDGVQAAPPTRSIQAATAAKESNCLAWPQRLIRNALPWHWRRWPANAA